MEKRSKRTLAATAAQRLHLTVDLFRRNELANHAAAGAYGFLLSAAPALLLAAYFISNTLRLTPDGAAALLSSLGTLGDAMDVETLVQGFLSSPLSGFSGVLALANLLWTARVFALSLLRGLRVVYSESGHPNPLRNNLLTVAIEAAALLFILAYVASARAAHAVQGGTAPAILKGVFYALAKSVPHLGLAVLTYLAFRTLPSQRPSRRASFQGAFFAMLATAAVSYAFGALADLSRYDRVYGVLGALIVALANVYFFFMFFFMGAQMAFAVDSFDSLVFTRYLKVKADRTPEAGAGSGLERKLFSAPGRLLSKYSVALAEGDVLFRRGDQGKEVFYVISGKVEIVLGETRLASIGPGGFFGEMAYLLAEARTAEARAETNAVVLALPPELFNQVLVADPETARRVVEALSSRLKQTNERLTPMA
jgi:membrane protein